MKKDENGTWFDVRVRCTGEITRDEDADGLDDPPKRPRYYFLTGKVLVPAGDQDDDQDDEREGEAEAEAEVEPEWQERFPGEISYEDLKGTGSYRRASWGPDDDGPDEIEGEPDDGPEDEPEDQPE